MTHLIKTETVGRGLVAALKMLLAQGVEQESRNGSVLMLSNPVVITYTDVRNRVLHCPIRNANPFFHLMESLWMLAGRNDVAWPKLFNSRFKEYSDDGTILNGAYGYRWRYNFGIDQLDHIVNVLHSDPQSRRAVLTMWDPNDLQNQTSKDLPCNTHAYFKVQDGALNMTVCNRSNDVIWGAFGANSVHFGILLEYMAWRLDLWVGHYVHFTDNLHVYTDAYPKEKLERMCESVMMTDIYFDGKRKSFGYIPIFDMSSDKAWRSDLYNFMKDPITVAPKSEFLISTVQPMYIAWALRNTDPARAMERAKSIYALDWRLACVEWLERYQAMKQAKEAAKMQESVKVYAPPEPNAHQVGGAHYRTAMQHWDYTVNVLANRYLEGQIVKYVTRYRRKNGLEDLKKALHFTEKLSAVCAADKLTAPKPPREFAQIIAEYCEKNGLTEDEYRIVQIASTWRTSVDLARLQSCIHVLINNYEQELKAAEPGVNYTNQDAKGAA